MRDDQTKGESFQQNDAWRKQKYQNEVIVKSAKNASGDYLGGRAFTTNSLSGNERNRTFLWAGDNFADISTISGADDLADGRSFALLDYNNDGWQDIALMSLNEPRFKLYKNQLGKVFPNRKAMTFRLVGGLTQSKAETSWSNRDGIGAKVYVKFAGRESRQLLQRQSGEGFAGQNSNRLRVGLDEGQSIESVEVRWPSGKTTRLETGDLSTDPKVPTTIFENPDSR